jgi:hypothetical protein
LRPSLQSRACAIGEGRRGRLIANPQPSMSRNDRAGPNRYF